MHIHLVNYQVVGRTPFDAERTQKAHGGPNGVPGGIDPPRSPPGRWCRPTAG